MRENRPCFSSNRACDQPAEIVEAGRRGALLGVLANWCRGCRPMNHLIAVLLAGVAALALPTLASAADSFTAVTASVLGTSAPPVRGTDGLYHLVYELRLTNTKAPTATIRSITVRDAGHPSRVIARYSGARLLAGLRDLATAPVKNTTIEANGSRLFYVELSFKRRAGVPRGLVHTLSVDAAGDPGATKTSPQRYTVAPYTIATRPPVVLGPPLRGPGWVVTNGCCNVLNGHRSEVQSINGDLFDAQRYAIDFLRLDAQGRFFEGDEHDPHSYPSYGADVLAMANGRVVETLNDLPDQVPGKLPDPGSFPTLESVDGNSVIIDIGHGRFLNYAHLQRGSITVVPGQHVHLGQVIAKLGNSGNTSAPHLHIHVMNAPSALGADGLPFTFSHLSVAGHLDAARWYSTTGIDGVWRSGPPAAPDPRTNQFPLDLNIIDFP